MYNCFFNGNSLYGEVLTQMQPTAMAVVSGSKAYPDIYGMVHFYQLYNGLLLTAEFTGLPKSDNPCYIPFMGFHIHEGTSCTGTASDPFADALSHYNPDDCPHPAHRGDLPPVFNNNGYAWTCFFTDRFTVKEVVGRTVIVHSQADDFHTQPSGNSGSMIACGVISTIDG